MNSLKTKILLCALVVLPMVCAAQFDISSEIEPALRNKKWAQANALIEKAIKEDAFSVKNQLEGYLGKYSRSEASLLMAYHIARIKLDWGTPPPSSELTSRFAMLYIAAQNQWSLKTSIPETTKTIGDELAEARKIIPSSSGYNQEAMNESGKELFRQSERERQESYAVEEAVLSNGPIPAHIADDKAFLAGVTPDMGGIRRALVRLLIDARRSPNTNSNPLEFGKWYSIYYAPMASDFELAQIWDWLARENLRFRPVRLDFASRFFQFSSSSRGTPIRDVGAEWDLVVVKDVKSDCAESLAQFYNSFQPDSQLVRNRLEGSAQYYNERKEIYLPGFQVGTPLLPSIDKSGACGIRDMVNYAANRENEITASPWKEHALVVQAIRLIKTGNLASADQKLAAITASSEYSLLPLVTLMRANIAEKSGKRTAAAALYRELGTKFPQFVYTLAGWGDSGGTGKTAFLEAAAKAEKGEPTGVMILERISLKDG